jgi:hypothetical protein
MLLYSPRFLPSEHKASSRVGKRGRMGDAALPPLRVEARAKS